MRLLVDTNILLLHAVGSVRKERLEAVKLGLLDPHEEFRRIQLILASAERVSTTLPVLTEFSNFLINRLGIKNDDLVAFVAAYREFLQKLGVVPIEKADLLDSKALGLGLADASVYEAGARSRLHVLTRDDALRALCEKGGVGIAPLYDFMFQ